MVLELRPAHDPEATWGFAHAVVNVEDLSASVWLWNREGEDFVVRKVITISAEPAQTEDLPPALQPFGAVPHLSPTSTCRWTTNGCTYPHGEPAICTSTT